MRIRTIKPEFWQHKMHRTLSEPAALLALATLSYADDEGRFEVEFDKMKALLFTCRTLSKPLETAFAELVDKKWFTVYSVPINGDVCQVAQIVNFRRHQVVNKATRSNLPPPPENDSYRNTTGTLPEQSEHEEGNTTVTLPREGRKEGKGKERKEGESTRAREALSDSENFEAHIPTVEEVIDWGNGASGIPEDFCRHYHDQKENKRTWLNGQQQLINWRREIVTWWGKDRATWAAKNKKRAGENSIKAELDSILAELQWQKDAKKIADLKKRKRELEGGQ